MIDPLEIRRASPFIPSGHAFANAFWGWIIQLSFWLTPAKALVSKNK
jgi:hypothetical protein